MKKPFCESIVLILLAFLCTSCCITQKLWDSTNPNERIWISSTEISQCELDRMGVKYEKYQGISIDGYLLEKSSARKLRDYTFRALGTPVTIAIDSVTIVSVIGVAAIIKDVQREDDFSTRNRDR